MPKPPVASHLWLCHWERIEGRKGVGSGDESSVVWICEYPYHTIRADGPTEDCAGCPVWEALQRAKLPRVRSREPVVH